MSLRTMAATGHAIAGIWTKVDCENLASGNGKSVLRIKPDSLAGSVV